MTIYALSTAPGRAGIAVVRISGRTAGDALRALCRGNVPAPRRASLRTLRRPNTSEILDEGLVLWLPGPATFTGEDMVELHVHGGRAVSAALFEVLSFLGLRMAEPGEFTRRAFENGKLDLTEAEGLADLVNAETAVQRRQALAQTSGGLRDRYEIWRASLLRAMAWVEASLDFSDESDISESAFNQALPEVLSLAGDLERALADGRRGEILREGIQVAIVGPPNAGKSSLLNALTGREAAIVFDEPGTTRDVIEVSLDLDGFPFVMRDTAGLREAASAVEQEGIRRSRAAAESADIILLVCDTTAPLPKGERLTMTSLLSLREAQHEGSGERTSISVFNKIDLVSKAASERLGNAAERPLLVSAKTGEGLEGLKAALVSFARETYESAEPALITRVRHRQEIERALSALKLFLASIDEGAEPELAAEHLREAADALGRLTGRLDVEDVLGQIFSEFCIGK